MSKRGIESKGRRKNQCNSRTLTYYCTVHLKTSPFYSPPPNSPSSSVTYLPSLFHLPTTPHTEPVSLLEVEVTDLDRRVGLCVGSIDEVRD
jgi:hypothetical protein